MIRLVYQQLKGLCLLYVSASDTVWLD